MAIEQLLINAGFLESEVSVYVLLLRRGPISVGALSKLVGKPRTTLYSMLERLAERGLVNETMRKGVQIYQAENPEKVLLVFDSQIKKLERSRKEFSEILPQLRSEGVRLGLPPRLSMYEGREGLKNVLRDILLYHDLETVAWWPIKSMMNVLSSEFFLDHNIQRIRNNLYTRAIWPESETVDIKKYPFMGWGEEFKREIRLAPKEVTFSLGYWIYGSRVAFLSSEVESFGFIIESEELVDTLKSQFDLIWNISTPWKYDSRYGQDFTIPTS